MAHFLKKNKNNKARQKLLNLIQFFYASLQGGIIVKTIERVKKRQQNVHIVSTFYLMY